MKRYIFLFALMTASIFALAQTTALYEENVTLKDGMELDLSPYCYSTEKLAQNPDDIIQKYTEKILSQEVKEIAMAESSTTDVNMFFDENLNQIVRRNEGTEIVCNLRNFINWSARTLNFIPNISYDYSHSWILPCLHKIIQNKSIREDIFEKVSNFVVELCKFYETSDAKESIINHIEEAIRILEDYNKHDYRIDVSHTLYVDGIDYTTEHENRRDTEAWIARRVIIDKIPVEEMLKNAKSLLNRIKAIDTKGTPQVICCIRVNDEIECIIKDRYDDDCWDLSLNHMYICYVKPKNQSNRIDVYEEYQHFNHWLKLKYKDGNYICYTESPSKKLKFDSTPMEIKFDSNCNIIK